MGLEPIINQLKPIMVLNMVHPEGFEPPILGTGNLRFIQLSYGCTTDRFYPLLCSKAKVTAFSCWLYTRRLLI